MVGFSFTHAFPVVKFFILDFVEFLGKLAYICEKINRIIMDNKKLNPVQKTVVGVQFLFVAFGATVLVPLLVGMAPSVALNSTLETSPSVASAWRLWWV